MKDVWKFDVFFNTELKLNVSSFSPLSSSIRTILNIFLNILEAQPSKIIHHNSRWGHWMSFLHSANNFQLCLVHVAVHRRYYESIADERSARLLQKSLRNDFTKFHENFPPASIHFVASLATHVARCRWILFPREEKLTNVYSPVGEREGLVPRGLMETELNIRDTTGVVASGAERERERERETEEVSVHHTELREPWVCNAARALLSREGNCVKGRELAGHRSVTSRNETREPSFTWPCLPPPVSPRLLSFSFSWPDYIHPFSPFHPLLSLTRTYLYLFLPLQIEATIEPSELCGDSKKRGRIFRLFSDVT